MFTVYFTGYAGGDDLEMARVDMMADCVEDLTIRIHPMYDYKDDPTVSTSFTDISVRSYNVVLMNANNAICYIWRKLLAYIIQSLSTTVSSVDNHTRSY